MIARLTQDTVKRTPHVATYILLRIRAGSRFYSTMDETRVKFSIHALYQISQVHRNFASQHIGCVAAEAATRIKSIAADAVREREGDAACVASNYLGCDSVHLTVQCQAAI